ncbi:hypothetical protein HR060_09215 [Catenovulum sp. SM1970]|uniref:MFS transporter n=1 Tax=Marinifaba aquimaris TaxID=2741323 RepID=UPI001572DB99|nr:MFS transporter [Marinifaba aquimaris]NTS77051.1 hypothetical protein [Marinifaba aquimaris]
MAGLSYVNFLPALVSALATGIGSSPAQAGEIVAMNGYGGLIGSVLAVFIVSRVSWKPIVMLCLASLVAFDFFTQWFIDYQSLIIWRLFAGVFGGVSLGIAFSVLGRLANPDRAFGCLLFIQFTVGSLVIYYTPILELVQGAYSIFFIMAGIGLLSLLLMLLLPSIRFSNDKKAADKQQQSTVIKASLLMLAIILFQTAASAIWAYVSLIGAAADIPIADVSLYVATTGMLGLLGAIIPMFKSQAASRTFWLTTGSCFSIIAAIIMVYAPLSAGVFILAMSLPFLSGQQ